MVIDAAAQAADDGQSGSCQAARQSFRLRQTGSAWHGANQRSLRPSHRWALMCRGQTIRPAGRANRAAGAESVRPNRERRRICARRQSSNSASASISSCAANRPAYLGADSRHRAQVAGAALSTASGEPKRSSSFVRVRGPTPETIANRKAAANEGEAISELFNCATAKVPAQRLTLVSSPTAHHLNAPAFEMETVQRRKPAKPHNRVARHALPTSWHLPLTSHCQGWSAERIAAFRAWFSYRASSPRSIYLDPTQA